MRIAFKFTVTHHRLLKYCCSEIQQYLDIVLALVCSCTNLWHLELDMVPHKPENTSRHSQRCCPTLQQDVNTSPKDRLNEAALWAFFHSNTLLCCNNSKSSTGPAVQNAGH